MTPKNKHHVYSHVSMDTLGQPMTHLFTMLTHKRRDGAHHVIGASLPTVGDAHAIFHGLIVLCIYTDLPNHTKLVQHPINTHQTRRYNNIVVDQQVASQQRNPTDV